MLPRLREVASLSAADAALLCAAALLLPAGRVLLPSIGVERTRRIVGGAVRVLPPYGDAGPADRVPGFVRTVDASLPGASTCLVRAIVCESLLTVHGHPAAIRFGVARDAEEFQAHAWVERDGDVVLGELEDLDRFQELRGYDPGP